MVPAKVASVTPQRGGGIAYHVRVWRARDDAGWTFYDVPASVLHTDPLEAMRFAIEVKPLTVAEVARG